MQETKILTKGNLAIFSLIGVGRTNANGILIYQEGEAATQHYERILITLVQEALAGAESRKT